MDKLQYKKAPVFEGMDGFYHGFFGRNYGFGLKPFDSLNISFDVGDEESAVIKNRKKILNEFCFEKMVSANQVHGDGFYISRPSDGENGEESKSVGDADILLTDNPGQLILIKTADCQPVILADPVNKACAVVHSGWKGSVLNVISKAIYLMIDSFGSDPSEIKAAVGPALGCCCAEFINYKKEIPEKLWKYRVGKYNFDFREMSKNQLYESGIRNKNIWVDQRCTKCNTDIFFSYRAEKITGRQASVAGWL